ncbi:glycosyltransferase family 4 protein [Candidatus Uhrbacteria bacterium]|nr:glycosyltransferase family 4 protein [Candidatus Uhrbacteria bacterium]
MRIVVDVRHLTRPFPSGIGEYTLQLVRAMVAEETSHTFVLLSTGTRAVREHVPSFDHPRVSSVHVSVPNRLLNASLLATRRPCLDRLALGKAASSGQEPTVVFVPSVNIVSLSSRFPYVLTLHDLSFETFPSHYSPKSRLWHALARPRALVRGAAHVIVPSASALGDVSRLYGMGWERLSVIPHGYDRAFRPETRPEDAEVKARHRLPDQFALFVGTLERRKNIEGMMRALERYRLRHVDDLHIVLAGKPTRYAEDFFQQMPSSLRPFVHVLGYVSAEDRPSLYRLARMTLFPSIYEGFGIPILESMASGTPVITSHTSSMPEVAGEAAICVDPYNAEDLERAIAVLEVSPLLRECFVRAGLERVKGFSWSRCARETLETLEQAARTAT